MTDVAAVKTYRELRTPERLLRSALWVVAATVLLVVLGWGGRWAFRRLDRAVGEGLEILKFLVCQRGADAVGHVQATQGGDAVDAIRPAHLLVVGELEVGPVLHMLSDVLQIILALELFQFVAIRIDHAEFAVV